MINVKLNLITGHCMNEEKAQMTIIVTTIKHNDLCWFNLGAECVKKDIMEVCIY